MISLAGIRALVMCIYSQQTFVIQFRFVVSSIFKLFQTTLDPVCECENECEYECEYAYVWEFDSLSCCLAVCVYLSVCLPCGCVQLYSDSFLATRRMWRAAGTECARGRARGRGGAATPQWSFQQLLPRRCLPTITESETQNAQRETKTETETEARFRHNWPTQFAFSILFSVARAPFLSLFHSWFTSVFFVRSCDVYFDTIKTSPAPAHAWKEPV